MEGAHEHEEAREHGGAAVVVAEHHDGPLAIGVRRREGGAVERAQYLWVVEAAGSVEGAAPELLCVGLCTCGAVRDVCAGLGC